MSAPAPRTRYARRPRVGEVIEHATGPALVTAVHEYGRVLEVRDRNGRHFRDERAAAGGWTRHTCQTADTHHSDDIVTVWHGAPVPRVVCGFHAMRDHAGEVTR